MTDNVTPLARAWLDAKRAETAAQEQRYKIEAELAKVFDVPAEGSKTHKIDGFKVTVTQPVSRKVDADEWARVANLCPKALRPVKIKIEADSTGCKWLAYNEPGIWAKIASAFETKPGKIGFKVEEV